jgi:hypothetical protein
MRCEACHGRGAVPVTGGRRFSPDAVGGAVLAADDATVELPCPECNGSGFSHCCDGICAQPQPPGS